MKAIQTNLVAGEISRQAAARHDLAFRQSAAEAIENAFVMIEGGVTRAPGTEFIAAPKSHTLKSRLIVFKKSNEDVVIIEAGGGYFRYFDALTGAPLVDGGGVIETSTAFSQVQLDGLYWFQSADVMFFTCKTGDIQPRLLRRFADDDWSLIPYPIKDGPFLPESQAGVVLTPSASGLGASITVSAASAVFKATHVGARFRFWTDYSGVPYKLWQAEEAGLTVGVRRMHEGRVYLCSVAGDGSNSPPVHESGAVTDGGTVEWTYQHDLSGIVRITSFSTSQSVGGVVEAQLPENPATRIWAEGFFSDDRGWPFVGGLFQSRLWYFGAPQFPDTAWGSRIDGYGLDFADFKQSAGGGEVLDDHAVVRTLNDGEVNRIAWAIAGEQIVLGHAGGIVRISGPSLQEPITPAGASATKPEPPPGSYFNSRAIRAGERIIYASTSGRKIIALNPLDFKFETISARSRNKGASRFIEFAYAAETVYRLFALREDGRLFACAYDAEQGVVGWSTLIPAGSYQGKTPTIDSIAVAPDAGGRDRLWCVVRRTVNGATIRSIERMALDFDAEEMLAEDAVMADAAVIVDKWNVDATDTIRLTKAGGSPALRDDVVTLTASGFTFNSSWVGRQVRLRRVSMPPQASDVAGEIVALVTAQGGATATATLATDCPDALYNVALSQWAIAETSVSGLDHLEGESVGVWGDGADLGDFTVTGGAIDLGADSVARACVGLRKSWRVKSLPFVVQMQDGVSKGKVLSATRAYVDVLDAEAAGVMLTAIADKMARASETLVPRDDDDSVSMAAGLRSGQVVAPFPAGRARTIQLEIGGAGMGPASVLTMGVEYEA